MLHNTWEDLDATGYPVIEFAQCAFPFNLEVIVANITFASLLNLFVLPWKYLAKKDPERLIYSCNTTKNQEYTRCPPRPEYYSSRLNFISQAP